MTDFGRRAGIGDMLKSIYDVNDNGVVDSVPAHNYSHQFAGLDKISVHLLTGLLATPQIPSAHAIAGAKHTASLLAQLNALLSDATLDDSSASRTPSAHKASHEDGGSDEIDCSGLVGAGGMALDGMRATLAGVQTVPNATWTRVDLDTVDYDSFAGGSFNTTTHQWTCPATGRYSVCLCTGFVTQHTIGQSLAVLIYKNAGLYGPYVRFCSGGTDYIRVAAADNHNITLNDVYELYVRHSMGGTPQLQNGTNYTNYLAIHRLG